MKKLFFAIFMLLGITVMGQSYTENANKPHHLQFDVKGILAEVTDDSTDAFRVMVVDSVGAISSLATSSAATDSLLVIQSSVWNESLGAWEVVTINSPVFHYTAPQNVLSISDLDTDSTQVVISIPSYLHWSIHFLASGGVTYKMFISNIDGASATNPYDGNWIDYSTTILGAATKVDVDLFAIQDTPLPGLKVMIKAWTSDAANDFGAYLIMSK